MLSMALKLKPYALAIMALVIMSLSPTRTLAHSESAELQSSVISTQQTIQIAGTVTDTHDQPLIGVRVQEVGTPNGTVTDVNGRFHLKVIPGASVEISYMGYKSRTLRVDRAQSDIQIHLEEDLLNLDELVVVGYATVKRSQLTGSVERVESDRINKETAAGLESRLQGKIPGLMITTGSGQPGSADISVRIRGTGSINGSNTPLYIMDGVMVEPAQFASLNPADVSNVQVLKDASATAIYGSRGANGVIVITTKRGKADRHGVTYNLKVGSSILSEPKSRMMTGPENILYQTYAVELSPNSKAFPLMRLLRLEKMAAQGALSPAEMQEWTAGKSRLEAARVTDTDFMGLMTQNGLTMEHNVSVYGGSERTQFFLSGGFLDQNGILKKSTLKRYSGRFNLDHKVSSFLDLGVTGSVGYTQNTFGDPDVGDARQAWWNPWFTSLLAYPYEDPEKWFNGDNPTLITKYFDRNKGLLRLLGSANLTLKFTDWLRFKTNFGLDYYGRKSVSILDREHPKASANKGFMSQIDSEMRRYTWTNTLNLYRISKHFS